jgi:type VI secretion system protein ImpI
MATISLDLTIENESSLPDGGPLTYHLAGNRGADIGRDAHLDWTLPDPNRQISGKHCEIRFSDQAYWLHDLSLNGVFINGALNRVQSPYRLRSGDRLSIGHYVIAVRVTGEEIGSFSDTSAPPPLDFDDLWKAPEGTAAAPLDPRDFRPAIQSTPVQPDFLEWAVDVPNAPGVGFIARPSAAPERTTDPASWDADIVRKAPEPEPISAIPSPRRSIWVSQEPSAPWGEQEENAGRDYAAAPKAAPPPNMPLAMPPVPDRSKPPLPQASSNVSDIVARFALGAGLPPGTIIAADPGDFVEKIGRLMAIVADNLKQLLSARSETKHIARSSHHTMIEALGNNPLKFSPTASDALRTMLGPPSGGYLDADQTLKKSFEDLKTHQMKTFSAMQYALRRLIEDLDPATIEKDLGPASKISRWLGLRNIQLWKFYEMRWKTKTKRQGMDDVFMELFCEYYDEASSSPGGENGMRPASRAARH